LSLTQPSISYFAWSTKYVDQDDRQDLQSKNEPGILTGILPEIEVIVELDAVSVKDNGLGLPARVIEQSLNYMIRVSVQSSSAYGRALLRYQ
jgi:hypothetical protein